MTRLHPRSAAMACLAVLAAAAAGCGSTAPASKASEVVTPAAMPLSTATTSAAGTWATVVMGGSAAQHNNFWQLFIRPSGSTRWKLVTPPGTADNGGLVLAAGAGQSAITAFRPSQDLTYSPLIQTSDGGRAWSALGPLDTRLASTPAALAVRQDGSGQFLALTASSVAEQASPGAASWTTLASPRTFAATSAGRQCGLRALSAAGYLPSGEPVLGGVCSRPGTSGLFVDHDGSWQAAALHLPPATAAQRVAVLRLLTVGNQTVALLQAGNGHDASLYAAWSGSVAGQWTISDPLELHSTPLRSASFGPAGSVAVTAGATAAAVITSSERSWQQLPALPSGTATVALGAAGLADALAVHGSMLTVWQLQARSHTWTRAQLIKVPIQYGSSS